MAVDYDLAIIGGDYVSGYAARIAASLKARVALILPPVEDSTTSQLRHRLLSQGLLQGSCGMQFPELLRAGKPQSPISLNQALQESLNVIAHTTEDTPAVLASLGIDVILDAGQFYRKPHLGFEVSNRRVRARKYLIASGTSSASPEIEGLEATGYLTIDTLDHLLKRKKPPEKLIIIGGEREGIELAQAFKRLGNSITLIVKEAHLLPQEDPEAAFLLQAHLEAEGVRVLTNTDVIQTKRIEGKTWVQAGSEAIEADEIVLAAGRMPNVAGLNLETVGVKWSQQGVPVNEWLQTTNPRIFACGEVSGKDSGFYNAGIAVKNALFWPRFKVNSRGSAWGVLSDPPLAQVGLTEPQAKARYGQNVLVLKQYFKILAGAQICGTSAGFCKIYVHRSGKILGATIIGSQAGELIQVLALAIQQQIKIQQLAKLPAIWPSLSEIIEMTAREWNQQRLEQNPRWTDFLETFFHWCRLFSK
jgi:pyruvate/2-oxoglutarate dehydrogenase complex dihydrolipoamide dehydrogenase (E3) component